MDKYYIIVILEGAKRPIESNIEKDSIASLRSAPERLGKMRQYYVYILTNFTNNVLYTGITNDLVRRVYEHKNKLIAGFTQKYKVDKLVYYEILQDPENAIKREKTIKNLVRRKKIELIKSMNPTFSNLYFTIL